MPIRLIGPPAKPHAVIMSRELQKGEGIAYIVPDWQTNG
jgi:hypothetical protein